MIVIILLLIDFIALLYVAIATGVLIRTYKEIKAILLKVLGHPIFLTIVGFCLIMTLLFFALGTMMYELITEPLY